jgi:hypothetical protein
LKENSGAKGLMALLPNEVKPIINELGKTPYILEEFHVRVK